MSAFFWVKKFPSPTALSVRLCAIPNGEDPSKWERLSEAQIDTWESEQIAAGWTPAPLAPETIPIYRVSKDTIIIRCLEAGALPSVMAALSQQSAEQQFVFAQSAWFWSNNATLRGMCAALGLDAEVILAPDPHI